MRWLSIGLILIALSSCEKKDAKEEVKGRFNAFTENFNQQDSAKLANLWSDDGVYQIGDKTITGKTAIEGYFKNLFQTLGKAQLESKIDRVDVEDGKATLDGQSTVKKASGEMSKSHIDADLVNVGGKWLIQSLEETLIPFAPTHYEQLKELSWLIGSWQDNDKTANASSTYQWDYNKNFILEQFTYSTPDSEPLKVLQIIGWDPSVKRIRSWIFDSDGGFGRAFWVKDGTTWNASAAHILPDGRKSSSIHVYHQQGDNAYTYSSESREVDGVILPNSGPYKVVRKGK